MSFQFGNVVVVDVNEIGVIVKSWEGGTHEVYVRSYNSIVEYPECDIRHFVYSKQITDEEMAFYE